MIHFRQHELTLVVSPKVMSTSLKSFAAEFEQAQTRERVPQPSTEIHAVYPTLPFGEEEIFPGFTMVGVVRNPIDRFISGYRNKFQGKARQKLRAHLSAGSLNPSPSINELALNLSEYAAQNTFIAHHFRPQVVYLGHEPSLYEHLFTINESHRLASFLSERLGVKVRLPVTQTSGRFFFPREALTDEAREAIGQFYSDDFEIFGHKFTERMTPGQQNRRSKSHSREKMGRLLLHIGMPKTGSTAVQSALVQNRGVLGERGIGVSSSLGGPNNSLFSSLFSGRIPRVLASEGITSKPEWEDLVRGHSLWERLDDEIFGMVSTNHTYLVSAEHLAGLDHHQIVALMAWADQRFATVEVLCYVRDQVTAIPSTWQMRVKSGGTQSLGRFTASALANGRFDHLAFATKWARAAPRANLRFYEFPGDHGDDVVQHFFTSVLGLNAEGIEYGNQRVNESLTFAVAQLWRLINVVFPLQGLGPRHGNPRNRRLRRLATRALKLSSQKPVLTDKKASEVRTFFSESNRVFADQYLRPLAAGEASMPASAEPRK